MQLPLVALYEKLHLAKLHYVNLHCTRFKFEINHEVSIIIFNLIKLVYIRIRIEQMSEFDKGSIVAYREWEKSNRWIREKLSRCRTSI